LPSTHWVKKVGRLAPASSRHVPAGAPLASVWSLGRRDHRRPLGLTVRYLGGSSPAYEIVARGIRWVVPGHVPLSDIMTWINGGRYTQSDDWGPGS